MDDLILGAHKLMKLAAKGEHSASDELYHHYDPVLRRVIVQTLNRRRAENLARDRTVLDDLSQQVWLAIFVNDGRVLSSFDPTRGTKPQTWLGMIARRETDNYLNRRWGQSRGGREADKVVDLQALSDDVLSQPNPANDYEMVQFLAVLEGRLSEELSEQGRFMYKLLFIHEYSTETIMKINGYRRDNVFNWKARIRSKMKTILGELLSER